MSYSSTEMVLMGLHALFGAGVVMFGGIALIAAKGGRVHRKSGALFCIMLAVMMGVIAATEILATRLISALGMIYTAFACYLALTSWRTARMPYSTLGRFDYIAPVIGFLIGIIALYLGAMVSFGRIVFEKDVPVAAFFVFGGLALASALGDVAVVRNADLVGKRRLARHIWRMSFVLYLSTATLFTGPGSIIFPPPIRGSFVMLLPELSILAGSAYMLVKVMRGQLR